MFLDEMKWPEIDNLRREDILVVCCISALEQHGRHLPMGTDYFIGSELLRGLEKKMPAQLLCLPVIWFGASDHHMSFAGTISASTQTMLRILRDIASSVRQHGFRKILFLNSHGGNRALLGCSIQELGHEFPDLLIVGATYWEVAKEGIEKLRTTEFGGMGHACELETSIMIATHGELVDMSSARRDGIMPKSRFSRGEMLSPPSVAIFRSLSVLSSSGVVGDPIYANAQIGNQMLDVINTSLTSLCQDILTGQI
jgi:creatinine amidohydrolase